LPPKNLPLKDPHRQGYGDEAPQDAAIEPAEREAGAGDIIIQTRAWALFASGADMDIEERAHRGDLVLTRAPAPAVSDTCICSLEVS
jgi:hypothetical protein